ncbi:TPA: hypothetical protein HA265_00675 [Candidatus Woesearchaeota archaeon]|nr:hypothetical protein [Candidatus Woesearchaeota archaeon]
MKVPMTEREYEEMHYDLERRLGHGFGDGISFIKALEAPLELGVVLSLHESSGNPTDSLFNDDDAWKVQAGFVLADLINRYGIARNDPGIRLEIPSEELVRVADIWYRREKRWLPPYKNPQVPEQILAYVRENGLQGFLKEFDIYWKACALADMRGDSDHTVLPFDGWQLALIMRTAYRVSEEQDQQGKYALNDGRQLCFLFLDD